VLVSDIHLNADKKKMVWNKRLENRVPGAATNSSTYLSYCRFCEANKQDAEARKEEFGDLETRASRSGLCGIKKVCRRGVLGSIES